MDGSFAGRVRSAAAALSARGVFTATDLGEEMGIKTYKEKRKIRDALKDLRRAGYILRINKGIYRWTGEARPPNKNAVMWRLLRARRVITVDDLEMLAGVSAAYANEWLKLLVRRGVIKKEARDKYRLIKDEGAPPRDEEKAARLKKIRALQKELHQAVDGLAGVLIC